MFSSYIIPVSHCTSVLNQLCARTRANERQTINVSSILRAASRRSRYRRLKLREGHTRLVPTFLFLVSYRRVYQGSDTDRNPAMGTMTRGNAREPVFLSRDSVASYPGLTRASNAVPVYRCRYTGKPPSRDRRSIRKVLSLLLCVGGIGTDRCQDRSNVSSECRRYF